jgi:pimeloyl-ACP methyl ester carboxylesterase
MRSSASHRLQIDNGELFARVEGAGYPVLFLHGWTLDSEMWASTFHDLPRHYRLIATDRRGHGQSTLPADFSKETGDLELWLDHLHEEKVALVGMSQGGRLALRFASQNPDRVSALVLYGTSADGIVPPQGDDRIPLGYYTDLVQRGDLVAMQEAWLSHPLMHCDDQEVKVACAKMVRRYRAIPGTLRCLFSLSPDRKKVQEFSLSPTGWRKKFLARGAAIWKVPATWRR